jgi:hypothetical protein
VSADKNSDSLRKQSAQYFERELIQKLKIFNLSDDSLWELCFVVAQLRDETKTGIDGDGKIEQRLEKVAGLAADLNGAMNDLKAVEMMALSVRMKQPADCEKRHLNDGDHPIAFETLRALPFIEEILTDLRKAALDEVKQMKALRNGKRISKVPVQKHHAWYIKKIANQLEGNSAIVPGRGNVFADLCTRIFECAGVTQKPDGAIKAYLAGLKTAVITTERVPGTTVHKIR